jgi:Xaa-Pro aminopeptidase
MLMNTHSARLEALRRELEAGGLDGFVVPLSDEHMSEYVGGYAQRLEWLTGFNGSAGTAVVLTDPAREPAAAMFVDGRYTLQVKDQVDEKAYAFESVPQTSPAEWLGKNAPEGGRIGYDPWLHGKAWVDKAAKALAKRGGELIAVAGNPIDAVWADRPQPSMAAALVHEERYAGRSSHDKRGDVAAWLVEEKLDAVVIAALDSIAWLLNIRGGDIARTPVTLSWVIVQADGSADLFIAPEKVTPELRTHLGETVRIAPDEGFVPALETLGGKRVAADPESTVQAVFKLLAEAGSEVVEIRDPCVLPKAVKNEVEQQGTRAAHARDGAALTRFLHWLSLEAPKGEVTEAGAAAQLHAFRQQTGELRDLSFDTISGSAANGAIVHYRVSEATNRHLPPRSVYLVDSGGQYPDGTTDVTRTVWIGPGEAPADIRDRFTRVLKGHIALARAVFPKGTTGQQLDALARYHLWQAGLDYAHGTGHGVGSFLSVHEGPQRIAKSAGTRAQELLAGMIVSNEPGYYRTGGYGIRIENLELVVPRHIEGAEGDFLGFEALTLAPIDRNLVDPELLDEDERAWWAVYHARVLAVVGPQLDEDQQTWLARQCAQL